MHNSTASLLPINATPLEILLEQSTLRSSDITTPIANVWQAQKCPAELLPWLAWALSVDGWQSAISENGKRSLIAQIMKLKRTKGCENSLTQALEAAGFDGVKIVEANKDADVHDAAITYDGLQQPITNALAPVVRAIALRYQPVRCRLVRLVYIAVAHSYNAAIQHDGTYNYGAA